MSLIVETGGGLSNADAYADVATVAVYAAARGLTFGSGDSPISEAAIRRATAYIDATYRSRFPGYRLHGRMQALEWPRGWAYVKRPENAPPPMYALANVPGCPFGYEPLPPNIVPIEVVNAICEGAIRELATPSVLAPDLTRDSQLKVYEVGPLRYEYFPGSNPSTVFQTIEMALSGLLSPSSPFTARAVRG